MQQEFRDVIENRPFAEIKVGDKASLTRILTKEDVQLFAILTGDVNPTVLDEEFARTHLYHRIVAPGMWGGSLISAVLGTKYPGPGTIYADQSLHFLRPVSLGDTITATLTVTGRNEADHRVTFECECINQKGEVVISGIAVVIAPTEKIRRERAELPTVRLMDSYARYYRHLLDLSRDMAPIRTAVVHPADKVSLMGAIQAAREDLIVPVLIGPEAKIRAVAAAEGADISGYTIINTEHSHAAAEKGVALARAGEVEAIMKGSLHTDELMGEVVDKATGIRTARRVSHVFIMDVPTYPRPLFITDAAITIEPTLDDKVDIVQNAIDLAHCLGIETPKVAVLSAVETVTTKIRSTIEAAALCKMADRGQIRGAILDGPLAFDNVVSEVAAKIKGITSPVSGKADILLVPDLESGNMLAKQLEYLADAQAAGIVLGARVPIILTSRADKEMARMASCAVALLVARKKQKLSQ
ncbi:MAG: bifunctional enoyl-CoA hydratase/phosphate acetyltransferase [Betaproteobacteria bacterium]|nr:bifunctional enoyl-CoA hydratase/phosphate acetyltransferase [Betaproteobacteria bacterium]